MQINTLMPSETFASGTLANSTPLVIRTYGAPMPSQIQLISASTTRKIEVSPDNQQNWDTPPLDVATTTRLLVRINAPITHVRFTGVAGDKYAVL